MNFSKEFGMSLKNFMSLEGLGTSQSSLGARHFRLVRVSLSLLSLFVILVGLVGCGTVSSSTVSSDDSRLNPAIEYGKMTDKRDGQTYRTVIIGAQTWMAENLNYETENSICYNDDADKCAEYGRLYTMDDAMGKTEAQGVCPSGWHLPTEAEWNTLLEHGNQDELKSMTGWYSGNGTDDYGFSILPSGMYYDGTFYDEGYNFRYWTIDEDDGDNLKSLGLFKDMLLFASYADDKYAKYSVRCLKD